MRGQKILAVICLVLLVGCAGSRSYYVYEVQYDLHLRIADRQINKEDLETRIGSVQQIGQNQYHFSDDYLSLTVIPESEVLRFSAGTKRDSAFSIRWEQVQFINPRGRIFIAQYQREPRLLLAAQQFSSTNHEISGKLTPYRPKADSMEVSFPAGRSDESIALIGPQFGAVKDTADSAMNGDKFPDYLKESAGKNIEKKIGLVLPVRIGKSELRYTLWFEVTGFNIDEPTQRTASIF
ncbi:MAG: hypothetical protein K9N46_09855 [Candidatus Marinimicrobia bacterium]|nr:hypothetical protein [Candidatus Neomarinimicrobiota bacterium]MCF7828379.1 hypothetical protein [Candidatus Neomarinimicrobiota bacterium]MCF7881027.1 hypothetical protein [Candidatus Neomarinimicrobiota bacterium]